MQQRRFEELPAANPEGVRALDEDHPAILGKTTLFPSTVVDGGKTREALLIPGANNRKIGRMVTKGAWKGMPIYMLTLTERATCPSSCFMYRNCYGNAMPFARRHTPNAAFEARLEEAIAHCARTHPRGFVVRLHVLGDFYSVDYVKLWHSMLASTPELHIYGYTAVGDSPEDEHLSIADAIAAMNDEFADRCHIRWSMDYTADGMPSGAATVIDRVPESANVPEGLVCPAEREKTACCATCGLCWEAATRETTIVFIKHGLGSRKGERIAAAATKTDANGLRRIQPIENYVGLAASVKNAPPTMLWVDPSELYVDETYQRSLSRASLRLISSIISNWNWTHYKCPIVVRDEVQRLYVVDGQHTAIAAATHPDIPQIPIMLASADLVADRARAFIALNKDRVAVTPLQLHHSSIVAQDDESLEIERVCREAGVRILRIVPSNVTNYEPGDTTALATIRTLIRKRGAVRAALVLGILAEAKRAPVRADEIKALDLALASHMVPREVAVSMIENWPYDVGISTAREFSASTGLSAAESLSAVFLKRLTAAAHKHDREREPA